MTCPSTLSVVNQSSAPPYKAVTLGPSNHSPPPMEAPPRTSPGPSSANQFFQVNRGGLISSPVSQRGISCEPGCGAENVCSLAPAAAPATEGPPGLLSFSLDMV